MAMERLRLMKRILFARGILRHWDCHDKRMDNLNNDLRSEVEYTENKKGNIGMEIFIERYKLFVNNYKIAGKVQCLER